MLEEETLTIKEVASFLRVHQNTVYALIKEGSLEASRIRRQYRIKKEDLMDYLNK
jgi:excisionase family DNA binding protein